MAVVAPVLGADRESYDRSCDEDEVHNHENRLKLAHYLRHDRSQNAMAADASEKYPVDSPVGRCPVAIAGYDNDGKQHQRETICQRIFSLRTLRNERYAKAHSQQNIVRPPSLVCYCSQPESIMDSWLQATRRNASTSIVRQM